MHSPFLCVLALCRLLGILLFTFGATQAHSAVYLNNTDNEDNFGTGNPDYDMGSAGAGCVFNVDSIHPVEFKIDIGVSPPTENAYLSIYINDIDWPDEKNEVFLNGHSLGFATGTNNRDGSTLFVVPDISWVQPGANLVTVNIDTLSSSWCAWVESGQLIIDEGMGKGTATIRTLSTDRPDYAWGDTVNVSLDVDTALATQDTQIELVVRNTQGEIVIFDTNPSAQYWPVVGTQLEPYTWNFILPATGPEGIWSIHAAIYDAHSGKFQYLRNAFIVVPATANPVPTVVAITPDKAVANHTVPVTITGQNFLTGITCAIGGISLTNSVLVNNNTVTATIDTSTLSHGTHEVSCTTNYGTAVLASAFAVEDEDVLSPIDKWTSANRVVVVTRSGGGAVDPMLLLIMVMALIKLVDSREHNRYRRTNQ